MKVGVLGFPLYPVNLKEKFDVILLAVNSGSQINDIEVDVSISSWDATSCKWTSIQTFDAL